MSKSLDPINHPCVAEALEEYAQVLAQVEIPRSRDPFTRQRHSQPLPPRHPSLVTL